MAEKLKIGIVGATGLVGRELLNALSERKFPVGELRLFASLNTAGELIEFRGQEVRVEPLAADSFQGLNLVFFTAHPMISRDMAGAAVEAGALVIDASRIFRLDRGVPLVVPEINPEALDRVKEKGAGLVASPSPVGLGLALVLAPIQRRFGIKRVVAASTHGSTTAGRIGFEEHQQQTISIFSQQEIELAKFSRQAAFNVFPQVGPFHEGASEEESDIEQEVPKILGLTKLPLTVTAAMVPIFCGASAAVNLETEQPATVEQVRELLEAAPGVLVFDRPEAEEFPDTLLAMARAEVLVGRLRRDPTVSSGINLWLSMDNLRKGSSLNLVQIAEAVLVRDRK
jgi:aspartate-semialdehyde dehydrogenase